MCDLIYLLFIGPLRIYLPLTCRPSASRRHGVSLCKLRKTCEDTREFSVGSRHRGRFCRPKTGRKCPPWVSCERTWRQLSNVASHRTERSTIGSV